MEKYGKTVVFPGGYGRVGEIPHGRQRPDWGLKGYPFIMKGDEGFAYSLL